MKRVIAILFLLLLTAQFVQVTMDFSAANYAVALDEEQKEKMGKEEGKETKEVVTSSFASAQLSYPDILSFLTRTSHRLDKPYLSRPTPPPDYACSSVLVP